MTKKTNDASLKKGLSKEELIHIISRLLRADDPSFHTQLRREDMERLVAAIRVRMGA